MLTPTADNPADPHDATTAGRSLQRSQEPNDLQDNGHSKIKPWITSGVGKTHLAQAPAGPRHKETRQTRTASVGVSDSLIDPLVNSLIVHMGGSSPAAPATADGSGGHEQSSRSVWHG